MELKKYIPHYFDKPARPEWVSRERLISQLDATQWGEPIFLSSPNGSGKTTLIRSWLNQVNPKENGSDTSPGTQHIAWLTLDKGDNDPVRFITGIIETLSQFQPGLGAVVLSSLQAPRPPAIFLELASLLREVTHLQQTITLVLDEYETINSPRIHQAVVFLASQLPSTLRLVLASGDDLPQQIDEARQREDWKMLTGKDLQLTISETTDLVEFFAQIALTKGQVSLLNDHTNGLALAVQMAAATLNHHPDPNAFWVELQQQPAPALDFFVDQVLLRQMDAVQEFLLCTSILDRLTGPLCEMVLRASPSGLQASGRGRVTLEHLSKNRLFTVAQNSDQTWFRYHPEFARLLAIQLSQKYPELVERLHQRASQWYEVNEDLEAAIHHSLTANDLDRVSVLIEINILDQVGNGQLNTTLTWLGYLSASVILKRPWLCIAEAWGIAHEGWEQGVETLLKNVEAAVSGMSAPAAQRAEGHIAAIRSQIALMDQDLVQAEELSRKALQLLPPQDRTIRCYIATQLGNVLQQRGMLNSASEAFSEAIACTNQGQNRAASILATCQLADLHLMEGLLQKVLALSEEALNTAEIHHSQQSQILPQSGLAHLYAGMVLYERDELDLAQSHLETSQELCQMVGKWNALARSQVVLASVFSARGNQEAARQAAYAAESLLKEFQIAAAVLPVHTESFLALQPENIEARLARLYLEWGEWQLIQEWIERHEYDPNDSITYELTPSYLVLAQVLVSQNRILDARRLIRQLMHISERAGAGYIHVQALILQTRMFLEAQDYASANAMLLRILHIAESEKMVRIFIDGQHAGSSTGTNNLYLLLKRTSEGGPGSAYARTILTTLDRQAQHSSTDTSMTGLSARPITRSLPSLDEIRPEPFTEREKMILHYLGSYLTIMDIASQLSLSVRTVDTIMRNLYRKLGVSDERQAIQRARELGII